MATVITNDSPLTSGATHQYINEVDFEPKLFFTDSNAKLYYILLRKDSTNTKVVQYGILNGYKEGSVYDYRFDFDNYIKIENQIDPDITMVDTLGSFKFNGFNTSTLSLCVDTTDVLAQNLIAGHIKQETNGEMLLVSGHTTSQIVCDTMFEYVFHDKTDGDCVLFETNPIVEFEKYFTFTVYDGIVYYNFYSNATTVMCATPGCTRTAGYDYTVYMLRIPSGTMYLGIEGYDEVNNQFIGTSYQPKCYGYTNYYFFNTNGAFDSIHCKGTDNIVDVVTKNGIQVGNKMVYTDINIQKQIKQNTGLALTQEQIYGLIESPNVLKINEVGDFEFNTSVFNDSSNWTTTGGWTYSNYTWSANNSNYSYLSSPVMSTADYGNTFYLMFTARAGKTGYMYRIEVEDDVAVETIYAAYITTVNNGFTFTCPPETTHFKIHIFGLYPDSGTMAINGLTLWTGTTKKENIMINPYDGINIIPNSLIDVTSSANSFGLIDNIYLIGNQTYTLSANGYISDQSYAANEYMKTVIALKAGGWDEEVDIYSAIPTTKSVSFVAPTSGYYTITSYPSVGSPIGELHIEWVKVELGSVATPYTGSLDEYVPDLKQYNIDTTSFEGYNGSKLSERNIELRFTDPKTYKRKTNRKITFFD